VILCTNFLYFRTNLPRINEPQKLDLAREDQSIVSASQLFRQNFLY
jgi:hypothetical protein